jgi:3-hydroxybutyryl-CoA dehydrogenase
MHSTRYQLDQNTRVAVIGAGSMGAGIAQLAAEAGHTVRLFDAKAGAAATAVGRIEAELATAVKRKRKTERECSLVVARIQVADTIQSLADCGLAIEAIVERLDMKQDVFRQLEITLSKNAVLATNTSSISISAIAHGLQRTGRVIGWHFFNPATKMKLVEIVSGLETDPQLVTAMRALSFAWGKIPIDAPNTPGFIVNRVARPYYAEGLRLLSERIAAVPVIDSIMRDAGGFAMGPFELMDFIGLDVNLSVTETVFGATSFDQRYAPHVIQQELVSSGRYGRKCGRGFYDYEKDAPVGSVEMVKPATDDDKMHQVLRVAPRAGLLEPLIIRLQHAGVSVMFDEKVPDEMLILGDVTVAVTDGRTAAERARTDATNALLLLDLALNYASTGVVAATGNAAAIKHLPRLAAMLDTCGIRLIALDDVAGLVVMRIVCCLANEAADLAAWSATKPDDIDTAMKLGTNYPLGPIAWADAIGVSRVAIVLSHLNQHYGDPRYRRSPALSRAHFEGGSLHD